jgi:hypothetical protein
MALNAQQALQEQIRLQTELNRLQEESKRLATEKAAAGDNATQAQEDALAVAKEVEKEGKKALDTAKRRTKEFEVVEKKSLGAFRSFARLSSEVQSNLGILTDASNSYIDIQREIIRLEELQAGLDDAGIEAVEARAAFLSEISQSQLSQAQATAKAMEDAKGINEFESKRLEIQQNSLGLSDEQKKMALDALEATETAFKKEQRILTIKESQKGLYDAIPESMRGGVEFAQKLGDTLKTAGKGAVAFVLLAAVVTAAVASFTALDTAAKDFRTETGLTNTQMEGIKSDANQIVGEFGNLGVEAKNVFDTVSALKSEFSDTVDFSKETVAALTVMNANFGVAAKDSAKVQSIMEQVGGLSAETAASVGLQAVKMAQVAGVAPAKVMADIAENAEAASTFFKGDITALTKNAIQARRMGSSLKEQVALSEKLLDFESGIEEELVAATFVSGQFNLSRARALAFEGKTAEAAEETLKQIQRSGDFRKKDYFTQQQLAKASGMTVEEINKQLNVQEKLASLSEEQKKAAEDAISKGLDITDINADQLAQETEKFATQQAQQGVLEQLQNQFTGIAATLGSILVPLLESIIPIVGLIVTPFQWMATGLQVITDNLGLMVGFLSLMAIYSGIIYGNKMLTFALTTKQAIQEKIAAGFTLRGAIAGIFASLAKIPFGIGLIGAAAAVAGLVGLFSKAGDVMSPADGKTRISTKEGGLFELSPNDDLIAAPGAASALVGGGDGSSNAINVDFSILSAPLNMMINEIKGLRADMASGKIGVYMDTEKVTSKIGRQVDSSTRNNFNLGQA